MATEKGNDELLIEQGAMDQIERELADDVAREHAEDERTSAAPVVDDETR